MDKKIQKYLLKLAKNTIAGELGKKAEKFSDEEKTAMEESVLKEKRGVFVTLEIPMEGVRRKMLRGCIGNISPVYPLEEGVKRNAVSAAFEDPRFMPLTAEEFAEVEIEISVLSVPEKLDYKSPEDLLIKLSPGQDGVILKKGYYEATYLPQVWEDLKDKEMFLSSLCAKAGMNSDEWRKGDVEVFTYQAEVF